MNIFTKTVVTAALVCGAAIGFSQANYNQFVGKPMPSFKMTDLEGKAVTNASLKGKVVVFDFWATWCGPCKQASPTMESLYKKYAGKGLVVVGANVSDQPGNAAKYKKEHGYTYRFATGGEPIMQHFGFNGIPAFVFVDKKGVVRKIQIGYGPEVNEAFETMIKKLLSA